jgi:hypothetical protein
MCSVNFIDHGIFSKAIESSSSFDNLANPLARFQDNLIHCLRRNIMPELVNKVSEQQILRTHPCHLSRALPYNTK